MKKIVTSLLVSLSLLFVTGCLDSIGSDSSSNSIVGKWGTTENKSGSTFDLTSNFKSGGVLDLEILITKVQIDDGTSLEGSALDLALKAQGLDNPTTTTGTWSTSNDTLTTTLPNDSTGELESQKSIYSIIANKLTITDLSDTTVLVLTKK